MMYTGTSLPLPCTLPPNVIKQSNPFIMTVVYATPHTWCQIFCGTIKFLTVKHNILFLGYKNTHLWWQKIFSPLHDITRLNCILFLNRMVNSEGIYGIVKIRIWKGKIAVFFSEDMIWVWVGKLRRATLCFVERGGHLKVKLLCLQEFVSYLLIIL
jgi:hypothetical protein